MHFENDRHRCLRFRKNRTRFGEILINVSDRFELRRRSISEIVEAAAAASVAITLLEPDEPRQVQKFFKQAVSQ